MALRVALIFFTILATSALALAVGTPVPRKLVLEEQRIEGKIRRPQLVLIKAEQRPTFEPIVVHSVGGDENIAKAVNQTAIDKSPNDGPFTFGNKKIMNYAP